MKDPLFVRDLHDNDFIGFVVNNKDPLFSGRCQVRVFSLMDDIDTDLVPWATPTNSTIFGGDGAGSISVPKIGQIVKVIFNNGDIYAPEYTTIQNIDSQLIEKIKDDYEGTHVLLYDPDEDITVIYQRKLGFQVYYKGSYFQISPDSMITLSTNNADSIIQMDGDKISITSKNEINISGAAKVNIIGDESILNGQQTTKIGPGPYSHGVLGEQLFALLSTMAGQMDLKQPITPGVMSGLVQSTKQSILSTNVLISK